MADLKVKFGKRLRELREERGLTQEQLAFKVGLSREYLSRIEGGRRNVSLNVIERLSEALNIPVHELLTFDNGRCE
jgi:transcriptional regulator with XRE-family HTH domain